MPLVLLEWIAITERDGFMAFNNQGSRPNYQSTILPLNHPKPKYTTRDHERFLGAAAAELSEITERALSV
jgi:catalase